VGVGAVRVGGASDRRVEFTVRLHRQGGGSAVARLLRVGSLWPGASMKAVREGPLLTRSRYGQGWAVRRDGQLPTRGGAAHVRRQRRWVAGVAGVHVTHRERVRMAVRRGQPHGARTSGW
jgi:hypothetical protein